MYVHQLYMLYQANISLQFSSNSEVKALELLENFESNVSFLLVIVSRWWTMDFMDVEITITASKVLQSISMIN